MVARSYLLDTNTLSALIVDPAGVVASRIAGVGEESVCTSIIVACELRFGAAKRRSRRLSSRIEELLARLEVLPLAAGVDRRYAELRVRLESRGTPIGPNDMLIAAHALETRCTLVTDNIREFKRVAHLEVENWLG
jgi:tRNA(fMet)-specific endonuclease VapC